MTRVRNNGDGSYSFDLPRLTGVPETPMTGSFYYCRLSAPEGVAIASGSWLARIPVVGEIIGAACQDGDGPAADFKVTRVWHRAFTKLDHARSSIAFAAVISVEPMR